jgi:hypothetical protein
MRIAIFKRIGTDYAYESIKKEEDAQYASDDFVRITEYIDVSFPPLQDESIIEQSLGVLDKAESQLRNKFQVALNAIEQQRQELRAITFQA